MCQSTSQGQDVLLLQAEALVDEMHVPENDDPTSTKEWQGYSRFLSIFDVCGRNLLQFPCHAQNHRSAPVTVGLMLCVRQTPVLLQLARQAHKWCYSALLRMAHHHLQIPEENCLLPHVFAHHVIHIVHQLSKHTPQLHRVHPSGSWHKSSAHPAVTAENEI